MPLENQTIEVMFKNIEEKLDAIHEQTLKTNGRVTVAEGHISNLQQWKGTITGATSVLAILFTAAIALMFRLIEGIVSK